jgi:hypothetical protein
MKILLLILSLLSFPSFAEFTLDLTDPEYLDIADIYPSYEMLNVVNFEDTKGTPANGFAFFALKINKDNEDWDVLFSAEISNSKGGDQIIYITLPRTCSDNKERYAPVTIKTNGQNVKYIKYCSGSAEYITPLSKAGHNFLVNEFKKKNNVIFDFSDVRVLFDATGFTKAWRNAGGDAL